LSDIDGNHDEVPWSAMDEPLSQPLVSLDARITQLRGEFEANAVLAHASQGQLLMAEIEEVMAERAELDRRLAELVTRARRLGVPVRRLVEVLGVSRRTFFHRYPS
jgi:hypothetical protein